MFVYSTVSELRFYGCGHPCLLTLWFFISIVLAPPEKTNSPMNAPTGLKTYKNINFILDITSSYLPRGLGGTYGGGGAGDSVKLP